MLYIEQDCKVTHEGHEFEASGAVVTPDVVLGYVSSWNGEQPGEWVGRTGTLSTWRGERLGTLRIVARWPLRGSWLSDAMLQCEATVDGITYTGRTCGLGMIYKGKRKV